MHNKKNTIIFYLIIFFIFFIKASSAENKNFIEVKINNSIITKSDILNEKNLLIAYNKSLKNLTDTELYSLAKDSLIRQEIKKDEILKNYELNNNSKYLDKFLLPQFLKILALLFITSLEI